MRTSTAIMAAAFITTPATAQFTSCTNDGAFVHCYGTDGTITNCSRVGNMLNCSSMGERQAQPSYENGGSGAANGMASFFHSISERRARSRVTKALKAGDCSTATREALGTGDMTFAQQVQQYCSRR